MRTGTASAVRSLAAVSLFSIALCGCRIDATPTARIVIDGGATGQTWEGFGSSAVLIDMFASGSKFGEPTGNIPLEKRKEILRVYYEELGMTRARFFPQGYELENDNDDPYSINWEGFDFEGGGTAATRAIDPYCDEHLAMGEEYRQPGEPFTFFPGASFWEDWLHMKSLKGKDSKRFNPEMVEEYAEHALAAVLHIKEKYDYELPAWSLFNEPVHNAKITKETALELVLAVGRRFKEAGLKTKLTVFDDAWPEASAAAIEYVLANEEARGYIGSISYHRYRISLAELSWEMLERAERGEPIIEKPESFYETAAKYGKPLWLTEQCNYGGPGLTEDDAGRARANHIIDEINNGKVSAFDFMLSWGPPKDGQRGPGADNRLVHMIFEDGGFVRAEPAGWAEWVWHFSRHIRPGDTHLSTSTDNPVLKAVAFKNGKDQSVCLAVINNNAASATPVTIGLRDIGRASLSNVEAFQTIPGLRRQHLASSELDGDSFFASLPPASITTFIFGKSSDAVPRIESLVIDPTPAAVGENAVLRARISDPAGKVARVIWRPIESRAPGYDMDAGTPENGVVEWTASFPVFESNWQGGLHVEIYLSGADGKIIRNSPNSAALRESIPLTYTRNENAGSQERGSVEEREPSPQSAGRRPAEPERQPDQSRAKEHGLREQTPPANASPYSAALDVSYGPSEAQAIDVYYKPDGPPRPAVVFIHGGGWNSGSRKGGHRSIGSFIDAGMAYVAVGYRLSKEAPHPAQVNDALAAVRFLAEHAAEWNIDASRLAMIGGSAGGQLAMWVAYLKDAPRISAVVSVAGQTDLTREFLETINPGLMGNPMLYQVFGTDAAGVPSPEVQRAAREFSPINHMSKESPPTLFIVGQEKPREEGPAHKWGLHHPLFSRHGRDRLAELGVEARLIEFDGPLDQFGDVMLEEEMKFLKEKLKPDTD